MFSDLLGPNVITKHAEIFAMLYIKILTQRGPKSTVCVAPRKVVMLYKMCIQEIIVFVNPADNHLQSLSSERQISL